MSRRSHLKPVYKPTDDEFLRHCRQIKRMFRETGAESMAQVIPDWPENGDGKACIVVAIQLPLPFTDFTENFLNLVLSLHEHGYWPDLEGDLTRTDLGRAPDSNTGRTTPLDDDVPF